MKGSTAVNYKIPALPWSSLCKVQKGHNNKCTKSKIKTESMHQALYVLLSKHDMLFIYNLQI